MSRTAALPLLHMEPGARPIEIQVPATSAAWTVEECVTTALLLLFFTHFYIPVFEPVQNALFISSSEEQTLMGQVVQAGVWLVAGSLMLRQYRTVLRGLRSIRWTTAFVAVTLLSTLWSQDPAITLRKAFFLLLTTAFGVYFASRSSVDRQLRMICVAACLVSVMSICFSLFIPRYGIDHDAHEGVWLGVFTQKNVCAREMLFILICLIAYSPRTLAMQRLRRIASLSVLTVIAGTQSKTAILMTVLMIVFFPVLGFIRRLNSSLLLALSSAALVCGAVASTLVVSALPRLILLLGRDGTLTGRTEIWQAVLEAILKRPILGYGFSAFWLGLKGESANTVLALRWAVPAAHNGFLEIWLQVGAIGLIPFLIGFLAATRAAMRRIRQVSFQHAAWPAAVLLLTMIYNLDESSLMQPNDFLWVLYVATMMNLAAPRPIALNQPHTY